MKATTDEIMVFCMARQLQDGEMVVQGLATPLVAAAFLLARFTHAPNLYFASAIGQGICRDPAPMSLLSVERLWLDRSLNNDGFVRVVADVLPSLRPKEFFRPAQVDPYGNFNNIAFGKKYSLPRMRLPGTGGTPDVTLVFDGIYLYVPRHSRLTFVSQLDFLSGLGYNPGRKHGCGPKYLVTDLGQFDFGPQEEGEPFYRMRLLSYHRGVTIDQIKQKTGFDLVIARDVHETPSPTADELRLLREHVDPLGIRRLELLSGSERRIILREIISQELGSN